MSFQSEETELKNTKWIGKEVYSFDVIDSTNKKAKELAEKGCGSGSLITARAQNAGVGRRGRSWTSEKDTGIYMSLVLRPEMDTERVSMLTLVAALSTAKALEQFLKDKNHIPHIKWPNDIVINGKKICGILTELSLKDSDIDFVIVGIGINVTNSSFPEDIQNTASSILLECGVEIENKLLITEIWKAFEVYYDRFLQTQDFTDLKQEYESYLINKGKCVKVLDPKGEYQGIARGINQKGELLVETETGFLEVSSGEVSVRGIYGYV